MIYLNSVLRIFVRQKDAGFGLSYLAPVKVVRLEGVSVYVDDLLELWLGKELTHIHVRVSLLHYDGVPVLVAMVLMK